MFTDLIVKMTVRLVAVVLTAGVLTLSTTGADKPEEAARVIEPVQTEWCFTYPDGVHPMEVPCG